jgi:hypothetical protein
LRRSDVECLLEVLVENIKESICESPHEEEDGDEGNLGKSVIVVGEGEC